ncbi:MULTISPECIES: hypothetical protein [Pseudomonas syringae group]|uniref:hypothetical protein n=1 Tax=Pseudomonas syringae group TaxID=136849 RepID=UPI000F788DD9|nr:MULTISPECIES: hypothetical protein [Pseudomonas syringae group]MCK9715194.1 hypothetical protein [Pseudomonas syringae pv. syringae]MCK9764259.1 hypothetical protein [Pseudomonas syringae pv. syringae]
MSLTKNSSLIDPNSPAMEVALAKIGPATMIAATSALGSSKAAEFAGEVQSLVKSDEFLQSLSVVVGDPNDYKSEDDYVNNAKDIMREMLINRLK